MDIKQEMILKISKLYRERLKELAEINKETLKIEEKLANKDIVAYNDYRNLEIKLEMLRTRYSNVKYIIQGLSEARECLF